MRRFIFPLTCILTFMLTTMMIAFSTQAASAENVNVQATSAILTEMRTGRVLYEKNANKRLPMASTTKIMTAITAIENCNINAVVTASAKAVNVEGSKMYLKEDEKITYRDLLYGLMLNSGNDAANVIAESISGSNEQFASLMNKTAKKIGLKDTNFTNPSGLHDENHYTTANELAVIMRYAMKNEEFAKITSTVSISVSVNLDDGKRLLSNHNKLLKTYEGCIGGKTGYTTAAGRCLVSTAKRGDTMLIAVTLNDGNDWNDHKKMLDYGFENVKTTIIQQAGDLNIEIPVISDNDDKTGTYIKNDIDITTFNNGNTETELIYILPDFIYAPVEKDKPIGKIILLLKNKIICEEIIFTKNDVENTKVISKRKINIFDKIKKMIKSA